MDAMYNCPVCAVFLQSSVQYQEHLLSHIENLIDIVNSLNPGENAAKYNLLKSTNQNTTGLDKDKCLDESNQTNDGHPKSVPPKLRDHERDGNENSDEVTEDDITDDDIDYSEDERASGSRKHSKGLPEMQKYTQIINAQEKETAVSILNAVEVWLVEAKRNQGLLPSKTRSPAKSANKVVTATRITRSTRNRNIRKRKQPAIEVQHNVDSDRQLSKLDLGDYKCCQCEKSFLYRSKLRGHMIAHSQDKRYKCPVCNMEFFRDSDVKSHVIRVHQINVSHKEVYEDMIKQQVPNGGEQTMCDQCGKNYEDHWVKLPAPKPQEVYKCDECDTTFIRQASLKRHIGEVHAKVKAYECPDCMKEFIRKSAVRRHLIKAHGRPKGDELFKNSFLKPGVKKGRNMDDGEHTCSFCMKIFIKKRHLTEHLRTHTGETPYMCSECGNGFRQQSALKSHMRIHTKEKPFECEHCPVTFRHKNALTDHMRIHTGEKPYKCKHCDKNFAQRGTLVQHVRTHTGEKPFVCNMCDKGFTQRNGLRSHKKTCKGTNLKKRDLRPRRPLPLPPSPVATENVTVNDNVVVTEPSVPEVTSPSMQRDNSITTTPAVSKPLESYTNTEVNSAHNTYKTTEPARDPTPISPPKKRRSTRERASKAAALEAVGLSIEDLDEVLAASDDPAGRPDLLNILYKKGFSFLKNPDNSESKCAMNQVENYGQLYVESKSQPEEQRVGHLRMEHDSRLHSDMNYTQDVSTAMHDNRLEDSYTSSMYQYPRHDRLAGLTSSLSDRLDQQQRLDNDSMSESVDYSGANYRHSMTREEDRYNQQEQYTPRNFPRNIPLTREDNSDMNIAEPQYVDVSPPDSPYTSPNMTSDILNQMTTEARPQHVQPGFLFPRNRQPITSQDLPQRSYSDTLTASDHLDVMGLGMRPQQSSSHFPRTVPYLSTHNALYSAEELVYSKDDDIRLDDTQYVRLPPISTLPTSVERPSVYPDFGASANTNTYSTEEPESYHQYSRNMSYSEQTVGTHNN